MNTAVGMARVSTAEQRKEGVSLGLQDEILPHYASAKNLVIVKMFTYNESASVAESRKIFKQILDFIVKNDVKHCLLQDTSRLSRDITDYGIIKQLVKGKGVTFHFVTEGYTFGPDSTIAEKEIFLNRLRDAEIFIDVLSKKVKDNLAYKVSQGGYPMRAPWGYKFDNKNLVKAMPEAEHVQTFFNAYATGQHSSITLTELAESRAIQPPRGEKWHAQTICKILRNPAYVGEIRWKGNTYPGKHEPLVSRETFRQVQAKLDEETSAHARRTFNLSGLVTLENGRSMSGAKHKAHVYYGGWIEYRKKRVYVREDRLFSQIDQTMQSIRWPETFADFVLQEAKAMIGEQSADHEEKVKTRERELHGIRTKLKHLLEDRIDRVIDVKTYQAMNAQLLSRQAVVQKELHDLQVTDTNFISKMEEIVQTFMRLPELYASATLQGKSAILRDFVKKIVVNEEGQARLTYSEPFSFFLTDEVLELRTSSDMVRNSSTIRPVVDELRTWLAAA